MDGPTTAGLHAVDSNLLCKACALQDSPMPMRSPTSVHWNAVVSQEHGVAGTFNSVLGLPWPALLFMGLGTTALTLCGFQP